MVTPEERLDLIDRLQRENAESEARIEARQTAREADPLAFEIVADARDTQDFSNDLHHGEPIGAAPVQRNDGAGILYRTSEQIAEAPAGADDGPPSDAEESPGLFGDERDQELAKAIALVAIELRREFRNQIIRLMREHVSDRAEMRRERALLYDEIKTLRRRLDLNEHGRVDELARAARNRAKRHAK